MEERRLSTKLASFGKFRSMIEIEVEIEANRFYQHGESLQNQHLGRRHCCCCDSSSVNKEPKEKRKMTTASVLCSGQMDLMRLICNSKEG